MSSTSNAIRILAVDDYLMFREALAALLSSQPDMNLIAEAANDREAIQQVRAHQPDITLMDLQMPGITAWMPWLRFARNFPMRESSY